MAKKKMHKKEEMKPARQQKTTSNTGVIVGIIVVAIIIVLLVVLLRGPKEAAAPTGPTAPTETTEKKTVELAPTPEFQKYCIANEKTRTALTFDYVTASCKLNDGTVAFALVNPTNIDVEGVYFEATSTSGKKSYIVDKNVVAAGATQTYTVSLTDLASAIGESVTDFTVYPAQAGKACVNAAQIIIKAQSCK